MNQRDQIDIKLVIIAEVTQVFLPVWAADSVSNGGLSPVSDQHLTSWKGVPSFDSMARTRLRLRFHSEEKKRQKQAK